jgi:hypothetical protein
MMKMFHNEHIIFEEKLKRLPITFVPVSPSEVPSMAATGTSEASSMAATCTWEALSMAQGVEAEPVAGLGVQEAEQTAALTEAEAPAQMEKEAAGLGDAIPKLRARPWAVGDAAGKLDAEAMETMAIVRQKGRPGGGCRVARFCHSQFPIELRTGSLPQEGRAALGAIARARGVNCKIICGIELVRSILIEGLPFKGCTDCTPNRVALDTLP